MKRIYLDHNATTPMRPEVRELYLRTLGEPLGNPSSLHLSGRRARQRLDEARERCAAALGVHEDEVVFTSGGSEANNLAIAGALRALRAARGAPPGLLVSAIEHSSVLECARGLAREGHPLELIDVDTQGMVETERVIRLAAARAPGLISLQSANNEIGCCPPVAEIAARLAGWTTAPPPILHTDAVQALGRIPLDLTGVQLATFSAHKLGGPLGVGVLVRRAGVPLEPLARGGEQEAGLRPGTENVPAIVAAALALELAVAERASLAARLRELAGRLWAGIAEALPGARLLGPPLEAPHHLPGTLNVLLPGVDGKVLVTRLDLEGLEASAGSACASGSLEPSHVLRALGLSEEEARAGLRLTLGRASGAQDVDGAVEILRRIASRAT